MLNERKKKRKLTKLQKNYARSNKLSVGIRRHELQMKMKQNGRKVAVVTQNMLDEGEDSCCCNIEHAQ